MASTDKPRASDDRATCERYARGALTQPSNFGTTDDELYDTHGIVYAWADRGDDIIAESNFHSMLRILENVLVHEYPNGEREDDLREVSCRHWAFGSTREIFVRVYEEDGQTFTPIFRTAVDMLEALTDYPILDESDYSDREYQAWMSTVDDALDWARRAHADVDTPAEEEAFYTLCTRRYHDHGDEPDLMDRYGYPAEDVRWVDVDKHYNEVRDAHFEWLAAVHWFAIAREALTPVPGQDPLFSMAECGCTDPYCQV